jgi:hypothetical protein
MTEERKHAILFAATLLCARKLIETMESDKPNFAKQYFVDKAIDEAAFILERIYKKWPSAGGDWVARLSIAVFERC